MNIINCLCSCFRPQTTVEPFTAAGPIEEIGGIDVAGPRARTLHVSTHADVDGARDRLAAISMESLFIQSPPVSAPARPTQLVVSDSNESILGKPPTLKRMFSKPLNHCLVLMDALKSNANPNERAFLLDQLLTLNRTMAKLVKDILNQEEELHRLGAAEDESDISIALLVHELRAPLQAILTSIELRKMSPLEGSLEPFTTKLDECYKHLHRLVESLPKLQVGAKMRLTLQPEAFSLQRLQRKLRDLTADAAKKNISVRFDFPALLNSKHLDQEFNGDYTKLAQVILNFANNAIKYGNVGGNVLISAAVERGAVEPDVILKFAIADDGPGISKEQQKKLFGRFAKGESKDPAVESSGIGLYLCKKFIDLMNYDAKGPDARPTLLVESKPGKGSRFSFTAVVQSIPAFIAPSIASPPVGPKEVFHNKVTLLCADDTGITRSLMGRMFKRAGCLEDGSRILVNDGLEAVQACEYQQFDVVFLDDQMPIMIGTDAAKRITESARKKNKVPPHIIMITGSRPSEIIDRLDQEPDRLGRYVVPTGENPEDDIQNHIARFGSGPRIIVLTKPVEYSTIVETVNALTER